MRAKIERRKGGRTEEGGEEIERKGEEETRLRFDQNRISFFLYFLQGSEKSG